jgi:heme exporter protein D
MVTTLIAWFSLTVGTVQLVVNAREEVQRRRARRARYESYQQGPPA